VQDLIIHHLRSRVIGFQQYPPSIAVKAACISIYKPLIIKAFY